MNGDGIAEWNAVGRQWRGLRDQEKLWRRHADWVNRDWAASLLGDRVDRALKTDSFDEAVGEGLATLLDEGARMSVGIDLSIEILRTAAGHPQRLLGTGCDVRCLPFADQSFDLVISNSTLDHFETHAELDESLREIARVLRPRGELLITLDNPSNPFVALRNLLPVPALRASGLVPYRVGVTLGRRALREALETVGFAVISQDALLHVPRVAVVPLARLAHRYLSRDGEQRFLKILAALEGLRRAPTRYLTGHYVAVRARVESAT